MKKSNGTVEYDNGASQETLPSCDVDLFTSLCYHYPDKLEFIEILCMKKFNTKKSLLIYSTALVIIFYLLPLLFKGGIVFLFLINPLAVFLSSVICGGNNKLVFSIVFITALLFLPTIFIFYNESAWIYVVFYVVVSFVGCFIGLIKSKKK